MVLLAENHTLCMLIIPLGCKIIQKSGYYRSMGVASGRRSAPGAVPCGQNQGQAGHVLKTAVTAILLIAAVTALTGCVEQSSSSPTATNSNHRPSTSPTAPIEDGEVAAASQASADSQAEAVAAATKALQTFAQPLLSADMWWAQMLPLLSQQGGVAYEGTDPAQIPAHQVTGAGIVLPGSTEVSLIVQLPTDAGRYNVTLTRPDDSAPWLADRVRPAQG